MSTTSNFNTVRVLSKSEFENNFSSTRNDTLYFVEMDNTMFDGQWVIRTSPTILDTSIKIGTYNLDLSTYCECVIKAINLTQNLNNKLSIISKLAELIDTSTQPLHNMLKKGGST